MQPLQVALEDIDDNEPLFVRPPVSSLIPCTSDIPTGPSHLKSTYFALVHVGLACTERPPVLPTGSCGVQR